jgi:hypothetical protein
VDVHPERPVRRSLDSFAKSFTGCWVAMLLTSTLAAQLGHRVPDRAPAVLFRRDVLLAAADVLEAELLAESTVSTPARPARGQGGAPDANRWWGPRPPPTTFSRASAVDV